MPTTGWINDTVADREAEAEHLADSPAARAPTEPRGARCPICQLRLETTLGLAQHVGVAHPLSPPILWIAGYPASAHELVQFPLLEDEWECLQTDHVELRIDGGPPSVLSCQHLGEALAGRRAGIAQISLACERQDDGASASRAFTVEFAVPDSEDLDRVDALFSHYLAGIEPTVDDLAQFARLAEQYSTAVHYASALFDFGIAVLVKDQTEGAGVTLERERFRGKLASALHVLRDFNRAPARAAAGIARFNLNDFRVPWPETRLPALDACGSHLSRLAHGAATPDPPWLPAAGESAGAHIAVDTATDTLLAAFADLGRSQVDRSISGDSLRQMAAWANTAPADAVKAHVIATLLDGNDASRSAESRGSLRRVENDVTFGQWATSELSLRGL